MQIRGASELWEKFYKRQKSLKHFLKRKENTLIYSGLVT